MGVKTHHAPTFPGQDRWIQQIQDVGFDEKRTFLLNVQWLKRYQAGRAFNNKASAKRCADTIKHLEALAASVGEK